MSSRRRSSKETHWRERLVVQCTELIAVDCAAEGDSSSHS